MYEGLTREYLRECFDYIDGSLVWKVRPKSHFKTTAGYVSFSKTMPGKVAGYEKATKGGKYYHYTKLNKKKYGTHRLIWIWLHDEVPVEIDHIDGNGLNNREWNLRCVSRLENSRNVKMRDSNTSGCCGVKKAQSGKWGATIHLGTYDSWWDAVCARKSAENQYGYHALHGSPRVD